MDDLSRDELLLLVQQLQSQLAERDAVIAVQQEQLDAQREALESLANEVKLFKRALFGKRRERFVPDPQQRTLFESQWLGPPPNAEGASAAEGDGDASVRKRRRGGKRGRIVIPESFR